MAYSLKICYQSLTVSATQLCISHGRCLQVCAGCQAGSSPRWQREAWRLVEEQMLLEARITLLKLASRLDDLYSEVSVLSTTCCALNQE